MVSNLRIGEVHSIMVLILRNTPSSVGPLTTLLPETPLSSSSFARRLPNSPLMILSVPS